MSAVSEWDIEGIESGVEHEVDLLISSVSYEKRCLVVPKALKQARVSWNRAIMAQNMNHSELHGNHPALLLAILGRDTEIAELDTSDPLITADALYAAIARALATANGSQKVLVDTTTFTHEALMILFGLLLSYSDKAKSSFLYSPAKEYSVGTPLERKWLSKGIADLRSVLGFPGRLSPWRPLHLVILAGLEHRRVLEVISMLEPAKITIGYGSGASEPIQREHERGVKLITSVLGSVDLFEFPAYDPLGTLTEVEQVVERHPKFDHVIVPLSTKLSTLGVTLLAAQDSDLQLAYPEAIFYNYRNYSVPSDRIYVASQLRRSDPTLSGTLFPHRSDPAM